VHAQVAQLFFLEAMPSALCFLNYFKVLGEQGIPAGTVTYARVGFVPDVGGADSGATSEVSSSRPPLPSPPWVWEANPAPLCNVTFAPQTATIEDSAAECHADFANRFVGGGCLENDFNMEEILFVIKPELVVAMALCSHMHDEEVIRVAGALQYSCYAGCVQVALGDAAFLY
jgi:hypothetical protein